MISLFLLGYLGLADRPAVCTHKNVIGKTAMICEAATSFEVFSEKYEPVVIEGQLMVFKNDIAFYIVKSGEHEHSYMSYDVETQMKRLLFKITTPPLFARN